MKKLFIIIISCVVLTFIGLSAKSQAGVLNINDPDVVFTSTNEPAVPTWNQISKWGHSDDLSWDPYSYGYLSYYFQGMAFRLKFPKSYKQGVVDGKTYPVFLFYHGVGESGNIWDNEQSLYHGGQGFAEAVNDSAFDGFILVPQSASGYLQPYFPALYNLIDSMVKYTKVNLDRITVDGLSGGGQATYDMLATQSYAQIVSSAMPISAAEYSQEPTFASFITIPIWTANGGLDVAPYPSTVTAIIDYYQSLGGNIIQSFFPNDGHDAWDDFWAVPNFWSWVVSQHKANPLVYFQHNQFCPNQPVTAKLGVQSGFYAYQWEKNGVTISGATADSLNVTAYGTYACRYERTATSGWSVWSPTPVVISQMQPTVTPPIQVNGLHSNVLPAPDGSTTVPLMVPNTYATYEWQRVSGTDSIVSTTDTFSAPIGQYDVTVTQQFGCSSNFSPVYSVIAANGTNVPPPASNLSALALSSTSIQIYWNANPAPQYPQTGFEIYRTMTSGSNYQLVNIAGPSALAYTDTGLSPAVKYYYIIRAINNNGAAPISSQVSTSTLSDTIPPTAPQQLVVTSTSRTFISLAWQPATDNVGVAYYDIYVNGVKAYSTPNDTFTVYNLTALQSYSFYVKARDASGNVSPASNQVTAAAALSGLTYSYYQGTWTDLPNFTTLTPVLTGKTPNVSLTPALQTIDFGFLWQGYIKIPVTGSYTFQTSSDDGSALYIGGYTYGTTPLVNNDGEHGVQSATGTINLSAGIYPIAIVYFQNGGGYSMAVSWQSAAAGIKTMTAIPNSAFSDSVAVGAIPAAPSYLNVTATSYNHIGLTWTNNSTTQTGVEVSRSTQRVGFYQSLGITSPTTTSFVDSIGLSPNTEYWYQIGAINNNGTSTLVSSFLGGWYFDNNLNDASGNNNALTGVGSPTFSTSAKQGSYSLSLNGSSQSATMAFSNGGLFPSNSYTSRTVGVWINPTAATISGTNQLVYSLGGSDNGIALRFKSGALQAGIASNSVASSISISNITTNANWVSGGWNYVAVVYNVNTLQLYVNGVLKGSAALTFSSLSASTTVSSVGASGTSNAFASSAKTTYYGGLIDDLEILTEPVNATGIIGLMNKSYTADTTFALPVVPAAPSNLAGKALSPSSISLSFKDNSSNETGFQLYRAIVYDTSFRLQATLGSGNGVGSTISYTDSGLYANTNYYYRVRAIGVGGNSAFTTPDVLVTTLDNNPVIAPIANFSMRYGSIINVPISATDIDGDAITITALNLPSFATLSAGSTNGSATIQLSPASTNQSSYTISVVAHDTHAGTDTIKFTVTVNGIYQPVVNTISSQTMNEGDSLVVALTATDQNSNASLVWSITRAPSFVSIGATTNGTANLKLKPGYAAAGTYSIVSTVTDGVGGTAIDSFSITVVNKTPPAQTIYMDMRYTSASAPAPWNNITGVSTSNLLDQNGNATGVGLQFLNTAWDAGSAGAVTGNNSGVYPDAAMSDYFWFGIYGAPSTVNVQLTGLTKGALYNVTLFGSTTYVASGPNGTDVYTINGVSQQLNISNNTQNTVTFSSITPDTTGTITINLSVTAGTPYGVLNTIVLNKPFNDGTVPILPTNLAAQALSNGYAELTWTNVAYNAANNLVYRAASAAGPYTLLNPGASNATATSYIDSTVAGNTTYYYEIAATNSNGSSGFTAPVTVTTLNKIPVLSAISTQFMKTGLTTNVAVKAVDDPSNTLTITVSNLPSFATYQSTGNGTGNIVFAPGVNNVGVYSNIVVMVKDNYGAVSTDTFSVHVTDSSLNSVYINFGSPSDIAQAAPWNNYLTYPYANYPLSNLVNDANVNTGFSIQLLDQWDGNLDYGMITGNNGGVFPDNVIKSSFYSGNTNVHTIQFSGLNPAKLYDIGFLTSFNSGDTALVTFASGTQSVTVDGRYNNTNLAQLNGLVPNSSGVIQVTATKGAKTLYLSLNGLVLQEYLSSTPIISPSDLFAASVLDTASIQLTWADKSNNETGFQVWRSTSANGTYTLVTTTAAGVNTYLNTGLTSDTRYFYKIRAINGTFTSNYSNIATVALASKIVLLHLNANSSQNGPSPWNNTDAISQTGGVTANLVNTTLVNTGFAMTITENFQNTGFEGETGTGIFPAPVMEGNYWTDPSAPAQVLFSNLDARKKYRIGCFGSNTTANYTTGIYSCNGQSVYLNSYDNNSKVVYMDGLVPNVNGQLYVNVNVLAGSPYCFTNAFTIEYYDDTSTYVPVGLNRPDVDDSTASGVPVATTNAVSAISVYPNPFTNKINVEVNDDKASKVGLMLYDASSRLIYSGTIDKEPGDQVIGLQVPSAAHLPVGSYILNVLLDGKSTKSVVLIKVN